jgi:hypothetical protein
MTMLLVLAAPLFAIAADEIKKESSVKIRGKTKIETDTYFQSGDRVLEIKRIISLRDENHMTQQKIMWKDSILVEFDISHMTSGPGQFLRFHSVPGVDAVTSAKPDGTMQSISLVTTNMALLRSFNVVDGLLSPVPMAEVRRANALQGEVKDLFQDFQSGDASGDEFMDRAKGIVKKYHTDDGTTTKSTLSSEAAPSAAPSER